MISSPLRTRFESVLDEQHLIDDLSKFSSDDYFDEVPLFSRYQQVDFLAQYGDANALIVELSLDYLDRIISATGSERIERFAAITIITDDGGEHLVPHIFICSGDVDRRLPGLCLSEPADGLGKQVQELVDQIMPDGGFRVLEDRSTVPGDVRVFVARSNPPSGFFALEDFIRMTPNACRPLT